MYFADAPEWCRTKGAKLHSKVKEFKVCQTCMKDGLEDHGLVVAW